jgi:uncharacterized protein
MLKEPGGNVVEGLSDRIFSRRRGESAISERVFIFLLGLYLCVGLAATSIVAALSYSAHLNLAVVLVFGLALPISGIMLSNYSQDWKLSTIGYLLVVIPFGILLGPVVAMYKLPSVVQVVMMTTVVTGGMWVLGTVIPPITKNFSGYIIAALLLLIAGDVTRAILPAFGVKPVLLGFWPWVGAILFSGLIVYDINKAMQIPRTLDNVADSAVGLYLDVINLFLRLLEIFGKPKDK